MNEDESQGRFLLQDSLSSSQQQLAEIIICLHRG